MTQNLAREVEMLVISMPGKKKGSGMLFSLVSF
jgi:hypothetical protein